MAQEVRGAPWLLTIKSILENAGNFSTVEDLSGSGHRSEKVGYLAKEKWWLTKASMKAFWGIIRAAGLHLPALPLFSSSSSGAKIYNGTTPPSNIDFDTVVTSRLVQLQVSLRRPRNLQVYEVFARSIRGPSQSASDFLHVRLTAYDSQNRLLIKTSNSENSWLRWTAPEISTAPPDVLVWSWYRHRMSLSHAFSVLHGTEFEGPWAGIILSRIPEAVIGQHDQAFYAFYNRDHTNNWRLGAADGFLYWLWAKNSPLNATETLASSGTEQATS